MTSPHDPQNTLDAPDTRDAQRTQETRNARETQDTRPFTPAPRSLDARLDAIGRHPFRVKFHLRGRDRATAELKGPATIRWHAYDLIAKRLAPARPYKDGKQTPYRGHPVFVAQHATATCCRTCLQRWHGIPKGRELSREEHLYVVRVILRWIEREMTGETDPGPDPCRADLDHEIS